MARLAADRICSGEILGTAFPSAYDPVMTPLEERAVLPFYLEMMGLNALHLSFGLWPELVTAAKAVTLDDAKWLLRVGAWRPVVMGAWFSVRFPAAEIGQELRRAMAVSQGSLTAPPLAVACVVVSGIDAVPEMRQYVEADPGQDGSASFVAAGIEHLGGPPVGSVADEDRQAFERLVHVATSLRASVT